jgi:hypothetical protein
MIHFLNMGAKALSIGISPPGFPGLAALSLSPKRRKMY